MNFKVNTKEKFTTIYVNETELSANMTANINTICLPYLETEVKNIILNLSEVQSIDTEVAITLTTLQQKFYELDASFVICAMQPNVEATFEQLALLDMMNITPTESEAWDIIQMEEIERELLNNDDVTFEN